MRGKAGLAEFTDEAVNHPAIRALRQRVTAQPDAALSAEAVAVEIVSRDGALISRSLEHAIGTPARPLSDAALEMKFREQAGLLLGRREVDRLVDLCWNIENLESVRDLVGATCPA